MNGAGVVSHQHDNFTAARRSTFVCRALRHSPAGGLRPRSRPYHGHAQTSAPADKSACTLGRRPDVFNGGDTPHLQHPLFPRDAPDGPAPTVSAPNDLHEATTASPSLSPEPESLYSHSPSSSSSFPPSSPCPDAGAASASDAYLSEATRPHDEATTSAASAPAVLCAHLRLLHLAAQSMHRRLDAALCDVDSLDLATGPDLRVAERLHKVLAAYVSLGPVSASEDTVGSSGHQDSDQPQSATVIMDTPTWTAGAAVGPHCGDGRMRVLALGNSENQPHAQEDGAEVQGERLLRALLCRVEVATAQLAAIGARHIADVYGPLRRFYFSPDEPLLAISLRSEQYHRQLERAVEACGFESRQVQALTEEIAAAMSSRTVRSFLELDQWDRAPAAGAVVDGYDQLLPTPPRNVISARAGAPVQSGGEPGAALGRLGQLAAAAAADYSSLQELRHELEVVRRSAEARGVPLGALLRLADGVEDTNVGGAV